MRAPRGGRKPGDGRFDLEEPRPFRPAPEHRPEPAAGLRRELAELRAEVRRLASEIDKLWARERGRAATPGRTARSIAGKPVRTGTRVSRPGGRSPARPGSSAGGPRRGGKPGAKSRGPGGAKRTGGTKRSSGWAKPKSRTRRSGSPSRPQGR